MYSIIDIETTGGSPKADKITEIAIYNFDGEKITDEFVSLVNPERDIPYYITKMTGITNEMVADAPKFFEIAKKIIELTENKIFVAHNVGFDYGFVRKEFADLGYDFKKEQLCTVRLSRKIIPGKKSYSLGNLCSEIGISIKDRHRAAGDALATVKLFGILLKTRSSNMPLSIYNLDGELLKGLNKSFNTSLLTDLPEDAGVYYFHNEQNDVIYVGKSKNIRKRVLQHLSNTNSKRAMEMKNSIADISFEITGSELIALLLESNDIKQIKPKYNKAQRRSICTYGLFSFYDENGYLRLKIDKTDNAENPLTCFKSKSEGIEYLNQRVFSYRLCQKLCGLYESDNACFHYQVKQCNGACIGLEAAKDYNLRAEKVCKELEYHRNNMLIIDNGRNRNEQSVILIENGHYEGFGYLDKFDGYSNIEQIRDCIKKLADNRDIKQIINSYLRRNKVEKIIEF
ncbi:MAG: GIY-YIG nuclease family protein [Bacteroidales bacterium]|nr:GIY-YIG nuclease family protein [Bacteroidales bacterium]